MLGEVMDVSMQQLVVLGCIQYLLFIISITFHEVAHAWAAYRLGDPTAFYGGQVTLNPLPHIQRSPIGTIVVPIISLILNKGMGLIGWATAPYNPEWAERYPKRQFLMAMAGPAANLLLAIVGLVGMKLMIKHVQLEFSEDDFYSPFAMLTGSSTNLKLFGLLSLHTRLNLLLMVFNLIPLPPLDGSSIWRLALSRHHYYKYQIYAQNPNFVILGIIAATGIMNKFFLPLIELIILVFVYNVPFHWEILKVLWQI
jgi:Zn-dependent protease